MLINATRANNRQLISSKIILIQAAPNNATMSQFKKTTTAKIIQFQHTYKRELFQFKHTYQRHTR